MHTPALSIYSRNPQNRDRLPKGGVAFVGNYPPRKCGIATFTCDLCENYAQVVPNRRCLAVAVTDDGLAYDYPRRVVFEIRESNRDDYRKAAKYLNGLNLSAVCLQHEYGIFGGNDGQYLLDFLDECTVPIVSTLHTVIAEPTASQRWVTDTIIECSSAIIVMANKARELLQDNYAIPDEKLHVIPHGIPSAVFLSTEPNKRRLNLENRFVMLTFGLIGPGKGLEHGIQAMRAVADHYPQAMYVILGATHSRLVRMQGEHYRETLEALVAELGLRDHVVFVNKYVSLEELTNYLGAADLYITPYLNEAQITSGALAYASGCGCPVISTPYWHAREIITEDRGTLVPFKDAEALSNSICELIGDPERLRKMRHAAVEAGESCRWPEVARQYDRVFAQVCTPASVPSPCGQIGATRKMPVWQRLDHLLHMTDSVGIWQHARFRTPDPQHGYCLDDNARALLLSGYLHALNVDQQLPWSEVTNPYFSFVMRAYNPKRGRFRNFMSTDERWLEEVGSEDSQARALWVLGELLRFDGKLSFTYLRDPIETLFVESYPIARSFRSPRAWAFALLGLDGYLSSHPLAEGPLDLCQELKNRLAKQFAVNGGPEWPWPEDVLTYRNASLPHALLIAASRFHDRLSAGLALESLEWLMNLQMSETGMFRPIGNDGWHTRNCDLPPAQFDQQPIEAHASASACLAAWRVTRQENWFRLAENTFQWFLGSNDHGLPLYDPRSGGCYDGLQETGRNRNQGAESLLSYHLSLVELEHARGELREFEAIRQALRQYSWLQVVPHCLSDDGVTPMFTGSERSRTLDLDDRPCGTRADFTSPYHIIQI